MRISMIIKLLLAIAAGGFVFQNQGCTTPNVGLALQQAALVSTVLNFPGPTTVFPGPRTVFVP